MKNTNKRANIIHINFNETDYEDLLEYHALESYVWRITILQNQIIISLLMKFRCAVALKKLYQKEIDFVAVHQGEKIYIQVANSISDPDTFEREIKPLLQIRDAYPKMIITRIYQPAYQHEGVKTIDAADWLLDTHFMI